MSRQNIIDIMQSKITDPSSFNFDHLMGPGLYNLLSPMDIEQLHQIATSVRYSGNIRKKYQLIDNIMKPRGFRKVGAGTNRVVYQYLEDHSFLLKIAVDDVGINDNPREFKNQMVIKPFCAKTFEVDPTGTVAVVEQVNAIQNRKEFESVADDIYDLINGFLIGEYIMADIGTHYFMNWGVRTGFGPVLIDYPYLYKLDGDKLHCNAPDKNDPTKPCNGIIDYDDGFNKLYCTKCGKWYRVRELAKLEGISENIFTSGKSHERRTKMKFNVKRGDVVIASNSESNDVFVASTQSIVRNHPKTNTNTTAKTGKFSIVVKRVHTNNNRLNNNPAKNSSTASASKQTDENKTNAKKHVYQAKPEETTRETSKPSMSSTNSNNNSSYQYNNRRGIAYADKKVDVAENNNFKKKKNNTHYKRVSYNDEFNMLSGISDDGKKAVFELDEYPEVVKSIVDNSKYANELLRMKSNTINTLQENNKDLMASIDSLNKTIENLKQKLADSVSAEEYDNVVSRLKDIEQEVLDLKYNNPSDKVADAMVKATDNEKIGPDEDEIEEMNHVANNVEAAFFPGYVTTTDMLNIKMHDGSILKNRKVIIASIDMDRFYHLKDMYSDILQNPNMTEDEKKSANIMIHTLIIDKINNISVDRLLKNVEPVKINASDIPLMEVDFLDQQIHDDAEDEEESENEEQ